jgi:hypothetical protein
MAKDLDKFELRYGAIKGRCNAKRKKHPGLLCKRYPLRGHKRCKYHGAGWYWRTDRATHTQPATLARMAKRAERKALLECGRNTPQESIDM